MIAKKKAKKQSSIKEVVKEIYRESKEARELVKKLRNLHREGLLNKCTIKVLEEYP